jgi:hypothetical protein
MFDPLLANSSFEGTLVARQHRAILSPATNSETSAIGPLLALLRTATGSEIVCLSGQTGSDRHTVKMARMTQLRHVANLAVCCRPRLSGVVLG